jgi:hypothetical protein
MKLKTRWAVPIAAALAITAGAAAFAASGSSATPVVDTTGVVGYSAVQNGNDTYFTHEGGQFGLGDPQYNVDNPQVPFNPVVGLLLNTLSTSSWHSFTNPGGVTVKAIRVGLCGGTNAFSANTTIQELIIPNSATTYDVVAVYGKFAANGGDACMDSALPSGEAHLVLHSIPDRDTVKLDLLYDGEHAHNGTFPGYASFIATDLSVPAANQVNSATAVFPVGGSGHSSEFFEAQDGLLGANGGTPTSSLAGTVLPDSNFPDLVFKEAHVLLNGNDIATGTEITASLQSGAAWTVVPDAAEQGDVITGAPSVFKSDHFSVFTAPGVFPAAV